MPNPITLQSSVTYIDFFVIARILLKRTRTVRRGNALRLAVAKAVGDRDVRGFYTSKFPP